MKLKRFEPILCIDPGPKTSGVCVFDGLNIIKALPREPTLDLLYSLDFDYSKIKTMLIEGVQCFGMAVGADVFETVEMIGRLRERWGFEDSHKIYRRDVKLFLCNSMRAKDNNVRQAIMGLFPPYGGGTRPVIGTKKQPGPLFGIASHAWNALALGLYWFYSPESPRR